MSVSPSAALAAASGVHPVWINWRLYSAADLDDYLYDFVCLECDLASLDDGCRWIKETQERQWSRRRSFINILVATPSLDLHWRKREAIRQQVTDTGATLLEVRTGEDPCEALRKSLAAL